MINRPFMPKSIALWLIHNTKLTIQQISDFCNLHSHELEHLQYNKSLSVRNPIELGYLSESEIQRCESNSNERVQMQSESVINLDKSRKYTYLNKRSKKPNCISWLCKYYPDAKDRKIAKLIGSTAQTVTRLRTNAVQEEHPVTAGLCTKHEFDIFVSEYNTGNDEDKMINPFDLL